MRVSSPDESCAGSGSSKHWQFILVARGERLQLVVKERAAVTERRN